MFWLALSHGVSTIKMFCTIPRECSSKRQIQQRKAQEAELLFDGSCTCASLVGSSCALSQGVRVLPKGWDTKVPSRDCLE